MKKRHKVMLGLLLIPLWFAIVFYLDWSMEKRGEGLFVSTEVLQPMVEGRPFVLEVIVANPTEERRSLYSIDFEADFLEQVEIQKSDPPPFRIEVDDPHGILKKTIVYVYIHIMKPGELIKVRFDAVAKKAGPFSTKVQIWLGSPDGPNYTYRGKPWYDGNIDHMFTGEIAPAAGP